MIRRRNNREEKTAVVDVAAQETQNAATAGDWWGMRIYCLIIFAIIYIFMVRPNKKRMAEYQKMLDSLQVGNRVLAAGIYGTIKKINEKSIELQVADGVVIEVSKGAVARAE